MDTLPDVTVRVPFTDWALLYCVINDLAEYGEADAEEVSKGVRRMDEIAEQHDKVAAMVRERHKVTMRIRRMK